jgi:hypothetical protein
MRLKPVMMALESQSFRRLLPGGVRHPSGTCRKQALTFLLMLVIITNMEADIPGPVSPPDPPQDQPGKTAPMPEYIAVVLHGVRILLGYGRHLLATVRHRAAAPTFPTIAACFGTADLATIRAHLNRGLQRAAALERFLLARAETGRDISIVIRRIPTDEPLPPPTDAQAEPPAAPSVTTKAAPRPALPPGWNDREPFMPTPEDLERQVRRRSVGRTIGEICNDLAVVPGLCTPAFWNHLFEVMHYFGGKVETVMREKARRVQAFIQEQDKKLGSTLDWLHLKPEEVRQVLGFFIGETPVDPFAPTAPLATGPP